MLEKARLTGAQVQKDIEDRTPQTTYQLSFLRRRPLEVQAADRSPTRVPRDARLDEVRGQAMRAKLPCTEGAREEASLVRVTLHPHAHGTGELQGVKLHASASRTPRRSARSPAGT